MLHSMVKTKSRKKSFETSLISLLFCLFLDRIRPICLPVHTYLQSMSFVGMNPFVTGSSHSLNCFNQMAFEYYIISTNFLLFFHKFITGWGITSKGGPTSPYLKQVQTPVVSIGACIDAYIDLNALRYRRITDSNICAGIHGGQNACTLDSGGPLMLPIYINGKFSYYQIGVVSYGMPCALPNAPTVYSSTQYFAKWIQSVLY